MAVIFFVFVNIFYMIAFPSPNGVFLFQDDREVLVCLSSRGEKKLKSFQSSKKQIDLRHPFLRGLLYFFYGLIYFYDSLVEALSILRTKKEAKSAWKVFFLVLFCVLGCSFSVFIFGYIPSELGFLVCGVKVSFFLRNLVVLLFKILILYVFVFCLRVVPYVNELFKFNSALCKKKHQKKTSNKSVCYLNYLVFVVLLDTIVVTLLGVNFGFLLNFAFQIVAMLLCVSVGYEILNLRWLCFLKYLTLFLVCSRATRTHIETVEIAFFEMSSLQKGREFMNDENKKSFAVVYAEVKNKLATAGITEKSDAEWIIATVLGKNRAEVKLVSAVSDKQYADIMRATDRRAKGESVDNIFGFTEFYGLTFDVNKKVLTPRMETELLVEQVIKAAEKYKKCTILDVGTGSGAIAISVAKNCDAHVTAVDISTQALATAETNAKKNGVKVEFVHSNLFDNLKRKRKFDIIVSNPPYIPSAEIENLDKNVRECDPILALDGGEDGLDFYRSIITQAPDRLNSKGQIFFEVGKGQASSVKKLLKEHGFEQIRTIKDYNKIERIVSGTIL